jgi:hypothetical protein
VILIGHDLFSMALTFRTACILGGCRDDLYLCVSRLVFET